MADALLLANAAPSGQGIACYFEDQQGNYTNVTSLSANNEVQQLMLSGIPSSGSFRLTYNAQTTVTIPVITNPPLTNFQWKATLASPGVYDVAVNLFYNSGVSAAILYQTYDGPNLVGSITLNGSTTVSNGNPTPFQDGTLSRGGGAIDWVPLGRFNFTTTNVTVQASCNGSSTAGQTIYIDFLRLATTDGATVQKIGPDVPPAVEYGGPWRSYSTNFDVANATVHTEAFGQGTQPYYSADPAVVQAAIAGLPAIGNGNVMVTGLGTVGSPMVISFANALAGTALSLLTTSDSSIAVTRLMTGGGWLVIKINNGAPIRLTNPFYLRSSRTPYIYFPFIQSHPLATYQKIGTYLNTTAGGSGHSWSPSNLTGLSPYIQGSAGVGAQAIWQEQGLPAANYRLSVSWPVDSGNSTAVTYTVTNAVGTVLATVTLDQTQAPGSTADQGVTWRVLGAFTTTLISDSLLITLTNTVSGTMIADSARFERISSDQSIQIGPNDVVTGTAAHAWALTDQGPAPQVANFSVANRVGGSIYPAVVDEPKPMAVGVNINKVHASCSVIPYTNIGHLIEGPIGATYNSDGYPLTLPGASVVVPVAYGPSSSQADGRPWNSIPSVNYIMLWDGVCNAVPDGIEDVSQRSLTGTNNQRVFTADGGISFRLYGTTPVGDGTWNCDFRNLRIYPLGTDLANPPKFRADFLAKLLHVKSLRFVDPFGGISGNGTDFLDYNMPQSVLTRFGQPRYRQVDVAEIRGYTGSNRFWDPTRGVVFQVTTKIAHGFSEGQQFSTPVNPGTAQLSDGSQFPLQNDGYVHVISPTVFIYMVGPPGGVTMTNVIINTGAVSILAGNGMPLQDMVELCNLRGADLHLNCNIAMTDACLTAMGTFLAINMAPGLKVRIAYSNETWNYLSRPFGYCAAGTYALNIGTGSSSDPVPFTVFKSQHFWNLIGAAMTTLGRGDDMIKVLEGIHADSSYTTRMAEFAVANGITPDEYAVAPYLDNTPAYSNGGGNEVINDPIADVLTVPQILDVMECNFTFTNYAADIHGHRANLDAAGLTRTKLISYEGGPDGFLPGGAANLGSRTHAAHRHPRTYGLIRHILQVFQTGTMTLFQFYILNLEDQQGFPAWGMYTGTDQPPGTGDPVLDAANISAPDNQATLKSEVGGAMLWWASRAYAMTASVSQLRLRAAGWFRHLRS